MSASPAPRSLGSEEVACLYDHRELIRPILPELSRITRRMHPDD